MNVLLLSPGFPENYGRFATRLQELGANVLGVGDSPHSGLGPELHDALNDYVQVPDLHDYDRVLRAVALLVSRHGRIGRLDSNIEHWLPLEAKLRRDFNVPGQRPEDLAINRSKTGMKRVFRQAGIPCGPGEPLRDANHARLFAASYRYPLILKPDTGVGAGDTYKVCDADELERVLGTIGTAALGDYVIEAFLQGELLSFDGLTDLEGRLVHCSSHVFNEGIMEVVASLGPMHYYSLRELPEDLEALGRRTVEAFGIRGRFFHIEYFRVGDGSLRALEVNVRPPGGFTTDMMNYGADIDVYRLWAQITIGEPVPLGPFERTYHAAHVSRRHHRHYRIPHEELLGRLGTTLLTHTELPTVLSGAMGDYVYLLRSPDLAELRSAIADVEQPA